MQQMQLRQKAKNFSKILKLLFVRHISRRPIEHRHLKMLLSISFLRHLKHVKIHCLKFLPSKHRIFLAKLILKFLLLKNQVMLKLQNLSKGSIKKLQQSLRILILMSISWSKNPIKELLDLQKTSIMKSIILSRKQIKKFLQLKQTLIMKSIISRRIQIKKFLRLRQMLKMAFLKSMLLLRKKQRLLISSLLRKKPKSVSFLPMLLVQQKLQRKNLLLKHMETEKHWNLCVKTLATRLGLCRSDTPSFTKKQLQMPMRKKLRHTKSISKFPMSILICLNRELKKKSTECRAKSMSV